MCKTFLVCAYTSQEAITVFLFVSGSMVLVCTCAKMLWKTNSDHNEKYCGQKWCNIPAFRSTSSLCVSCWGQTCTSSRSTTGRMVTSHTSPCLTCSALHNRYGLGCAWEKPAASDTHAQKVCVCYTLCVAEEPQWQHSSIVWRCLPWWRLDTVAVQVLRSIAFLHSLDLIHSDLKPENILVKSYSRWLTGSAWSIVRSILSMQYQKLFRRLMSTHLQAMITAHMQ